MNAMIITGVGLVRMAGNLAITKKICKWMSKQLRLRKMAPQKWHSLLSGALIVLKLLILKQNELVAYVSGQVILGWITLVEQAR